MDDLAPAATERTSGDGGRRSPETFTARKKAVRKVPPAPVPEPEPALELVPDPAPEPEADHQLDVLA